MGSGCSSVKKSISSTTMRANIYSTEAETKYSTKAETEVGTPFQCEQWMASLGEMQDKSFSSRTVRYSDQIKKKYDARNHGDEEFNESEYSGLMRRPGNIDMASIASVVDSGKDKRDCNDDTYRGWTCTPNVESDWEDDETDVHMVSPPACNHDMAGTEM